MIGSKPHVPPLTIPGHLYPQRCVTRIQLDSGTNQPEPSRCPGRPCPWCGV